MEHIETIWSLEPQLFLVYICSIRILNTLEVIAKTRFFKNRRVLNPGSRSRSKSLNRASDVDLSESEREDLFHPVSCKICHTEVGVFDSDELFHFFNVIASHK